MKIRKKQPTFFDESFKLNKIDMIGDPLTKMNEFIDWEVFRPILDKPFGKYNPKVGGRPHYDRVMMFKLLILQSIYSLSDDAMEFHINDRLSFMRFLGLNLSDNVPDAKTIWHFREVVTKSGALETAFKIYNKILDKEGFFVKHGSIIDASIIEKPVQRNHRDENEKIKKGEKPEGWSENKSRQKDTDASWTKKGDKHYFGFKNHIEIDPETKLINNFLVTPANITDIEAGKKLIEKLRPEVRVLYADRGYTSEEIDRILREKKIKNKVMKKNKRNKILSVKEEIENKTIARFRCRVEHVFGMMKRQKKKYQLMCNGLKRARGQITLMNIGYNLQQSIKLKERKIKLGIE